MLYHVHVPVSYSILYSYPYPCILGQNPSLFVGISITESYSKKSVQYLSLDVVIGYLLINPEKHRFILLQHLYSTSQKYNQQQSK